MIEKGTVTPALSDRLREREDELESVKIAITEQELTKEKFSENQIVFFLSQFKGGNVNDMEYKKTPDRYVRKFDFPLR